MNTTGYQKLRLSVVLGVNYSGDFLRTMLIFKNLKKPTKHDPKFDKRIEVIGKQSGTMDSQLMIEYVKNIVLPYYGTNKEV